MLKLEIGSRRRVLVCAAGLLASALLTAGCGGSTPPQVAANAPEKAAPQPAQPPEDPEKLANISVLDQSATEMVLPLGEPDDAELLAGSAQTTRSDYKRPFLSTVRIEHGGKITTGSIIHCSPRYGVYILSCRHGREAGGPWTARCSGGAVIYGEKYVISKDSDLCLLKSAAQYDLGHARFAPLRLEGLEKAEPCVSIGYDNPVGGGEFSNEAGVSPRPWTEEQPGNLLVSRDGYPLILVSAPSGPGRSGGGLFMSRTAELVGVCSFKNILGTHFVGRRSVLSFLNRCQSLGHVPWWTPVQVPPPSEGPFLKPKQDAEGGSGAAKAAAQQQKS